MAKGLRRKKTTIPTGPGVTAEGIAAQLKGFEWSGGPYRYELSGDFGCFQVWASDRGEALRVIEKLWQLSGLPDTQRATGIVVEGPVKGQRFQAVKRFQLEVHDGMAMVSIRDGPTGSPEYPVVV
jgi:hypothetical protein